MQLDNIDYNPGAARERALANTPADPCPACGVRHTPAQQFDAGDPRPFDMCPGTGTYFATADPGAPRPADMFGRADSIREGVCPACTKPVGMFRDRLSAREHRISGLCQACQDDVFDDDMVAVTS